MHSSVIAYWNEKTTPLGVSQEKLILSPSLPFGLRMVCWGGEGGGDGGGGEWHR